MTGCGTLAPNGPYQADRVAYDADMAIATSYDLIHTFVSWEYTNRERLGTRPEITRAADLMRTKAPQWFATALALRDAYANSPNEGTRDALQAAVAVLRQAMIEATAYLQVAPAIVK